MEKPDEEIIEYVKMRSGMNDKSAEKSIDERLKSIDKHLYAIRSFLVMVVILLLWMLLK